MSKYLYYIYGWLMVRPRRWFFRKMMAYGSFDIRWWPEYDEIWEKWKLPNIHWWILYNTIFKFFKWLYYEAWRVFCDWTGGYRRTFPLIARIIQRIGSTTAGYVIIGGECYHCASREGCQYDLSEDETGENFKLINTWTVGTEYGTDYRFCGITICPKCGHQSEYEDGSL